MIPHQKLKFKKILKTPKPDTSLFQYRQRSRFAGEKKKTTAKLLLRYRTERARCVSCPWGSPQRKQALSPPAQRLQRRPIGATHSNKIGRAHV